MHPGYLAPVLVLTPFLRGQAEPAPPPKAFLEVTANTSEPFQHQRIRIQLRCGIAQSFARDHLVQRFRLPLDLPIQIDAPFLAGLPDMRRLPPPPGSPAARPLKLVRIAINQAAAVARRLPDERRRGIVYTVLQIEQHYAALTPGTFQIPPAVLRYAHATRFRDDPLRGRVPLNQRDAQVRSASTTLSVAPLPTQGRPHNFGGAVGRFQITARAQPQSLAPGESLQLTLRIAGEGNFHDLALPSLASRPGLHILGQIERPVPGAREVVYDISPDSGVTGIDPVQFSFFEPGPGQSGRYRTIASPFLPLKVRGGAGAVTPNTAGEPGVDDIYALKSSTGRTSRAADLSALGLPILLMSCCLPWLLTFGLRRVLENRARAADPARRRALQAHKALLLNIERGEPLASAFVTYLAARTGCEPAAVISPDLGQRLTALGVPPQLAGATQELLERLSVRHYSGTGPASPQDPGADTRALRELVASLEREAWRSGPA